jgi:hypothetical protein
MRSKEAFAYSKSTGYFCSAAPTGRNRHACAAPIWLASTVAITEESNQGLTSILRSLNVKTARSRRGIFSFTHLAREERMTVTIGRRELIAALGGAAVAWPLAASAQQADAARIGVLSPLSGRQFHSRFHRELAHRQACP